MSQIIKSLGVVSKMKSSVTPLFTVILLHVQVQFRPENTNQIISVLILSQRYLLASFSSFVGWACFGFFLNRNNIPQIHTNIKQSWK